MDKYLVGVFDSIRGLATVMDRLEDTSGVSVLALNQSETETNEILTDEEDNTTLLDHQLHGTAVTSMSVANESYHTLPDTNIGDLVTLGPFADQLEIIYRDNSSSDRGSFAAALIQLGFSSDDAVRYQDLLSRPRSLVFVPFSSDSNPIADIFEESGSLFTEIVNLDPNKTRKF